MAFPWPQWIDRLKELQAMRLSAGEMAARLAEESGCECERSAVIGKLRRLGMRAQSCRPRRDKSPRPKPTRQTPFRMPSESPRRSMRTPPLSPDQKEQILGQGRTEYFNGAPIPVEPKKWQWPALESPTQVSIWEHREGLCRWPNEGVVGAEGSPGDTFRMCGQRICDWHQSYCAEHAGRAGG